MAKGFFLKMAAGNLMRNRRMHVPYFITAIIMTATYFIISNLVYTDSISNMDRGESIQMILMLGLVVISVFTFVFMLYINSFLIKRRKKEFALYGVLGLEKKHVARIIIWESTILNLASLGLGIVSGLVFGKLSFLLLMKLINTAPESRFIISPKAFVYTIIMFLAVFIIATLYNLFQVQLAKPIDLLKGEAKGEKKVRFVIPLTIFGAAALFWAYYQALTIKNPVQALIVFTFAVIVVIFATWALFTAGSSFVLTRLKKNKKFYYKSRNFIVVSGLIHRMKQNASGLSNICILSTMVIITISCSASLFLGKEDMFNSEYPNDINIVAFEDLTPDNIKLYGQLEKEVHQLALERGFEIEDFYYYENSPSLIEVFEDDSIGAVNTKDRGGYIESYINTDPNLFIGSLITLEEANRLTGRGDELAPGEVILFTEDDVKAVGVKTKNESLKVKDIVRDTILTKGKRSDQYKNIFIVVEDKALQQRLGEEFYLGNKDLRLRTDFIINFDGPEDDRLSFGNDLWEIARGMKDDFNIVLSGSYDDFKEDGNALYGGLIFIGSFFALLFITNTVLIIYFKQISEGYEDQDRYEILQKVGMDDHEVKKTINRQISMIFFLPLAVALIHVAAASNILIKMLSSLMLKNSLLTMLTIAGTSLLFIFIYMIVFRLTAKTYYKLVRRA